MSGQLSPATWPDTAHSRFDLVSRQMPVVVEIGDHFFHEWFGKPDRAVMVAEKIHQDRQRQLLRAFAFVGPFEAEPRETLDLVVLRQRLAVHVHDQAVDGPPPFVNLHGPTPGYTYTRGTVSTARLAMLSLRSTCQIASISGAMS